MTQKQTIAITTVTQSKWDKMNATDKNELMAQAQVCVTSNGKPQYYPVLAQAFENSSYGNNSYGGAW